MTPVKWLLLAGGAAAFVGYAAWWYRTREEPVAGRAWAAGLRSASLTLAWLLLLNPSWPVAWEPGGGRQAAFLDASHSMSRPGDADGESAWRAAVDSVARFEEVWLFGGPFPRYVAVDSIPERPIYPESRLVPALRAAAAAGARRGVVFTDGEIADAAEAAEEARRQGLALRVVRVGPSYPRLGIASLRGPGWVESGEAAVVRIELAAAAAEIDSVRVDVLDDGGGLRASGWAAVPAAGRFTSIQLRFPVSGRSGYRRYTVRLGADGGDRERRDDERAFYVRVTERRMGPVLISLRPDWETSFLLPTLDRLTDAPATAYLWLADGLVSLEGYRPEPLSTVQRRARSAPLLVLHGYDADAPSWARRLARDATRLLVLPAGARPFELPGWGVRVGAPAQGEWYASNEVPQSPLALELGGFATEELAPLLRVRSIDAGRSWSPLVVQRLRRGAPAPAVVAGRAGARRWAVGAAEGYWRWAFRRGGGRQLYRALWTGVAGWLLEGRRRGERGLEPHERVVALSRPLRWTVPQAVDSMSLEIQAADSSVVWRGSAAGGDSLDVMLSVGRYRYVARAHRSARVVSSAAGPVEVEAFAEELLPGRRVAPADLAAESAAAGRRDAGARSRHLATLGWPYLILIALFCGEWAVRRLIGLR